MKRLLKWILSVLYGLVMIEVIIMISPFAFYWYSLYAPTLQGLHRWRATAWLESFFLPHSTISSSSMLEFLRWQIGVYAFSLGILAFILCAGQVYGAKLLGKGVVHSWVYSRVRHPQYLALSVAAFGLLTMWPRLIILVLFLGMLFIYYFLARFEERQMEATFPEYTEYRQRAAMFIPGNPGGKLFRLLFGWMPSRRAALALALASSVAVVLGGGLLLRRSTIAHASTELMPEERTLAIAVWPMPPAEIRQVVSAASSDPRVRAALEREPGAVFTAHLLPADYGMVNMFADVGTDHRMFSRLSPHRFLYLAGFVFPFFDRDRVPRIMGSPQASYKVVFSRIDEPGRPALAVSEVTALSARMTPVVIAEVNGADPVVGAVVIPPPRSLWGDITMPMF
jgi:protein-S-isoprenylcysteine O-methyltransferase Ste14